MIRSLLTWLGGLLVLGGLAWPAHARPLIPAPATPAPDTATTPAFLAPYHSDQPLEAFLVFTATPRLDVPDGQIHWVDWEVPGIDVLGPDTQIFNMCPDGGQAWTLQGGDPYGGGTFVAVECDGRAQGWQMLAFHLCEVTLPASIDAANRRYTPVAAGGYLARECGHTHLSLGYWAAESAPRTLPCPQWYVQGRFWINAACLVSAGSLTPRDTFLFTATDDWELRFLTPHNLDLGRHLALLSLGVALCVYVAFAFFRAPPGRNPDTPPDTLPAATLPPAPQAIVKTAIWVGGLLLAILVSAGPIWPIGGSMPAGYTNDPTRYQEVAQAVGYGDWELLRAFYQVAVPRSATGEPAAFGESGKVFPPEAAAAIPFGETNTDAWGADVDPTVPGPYGQYRAWDAVAERWPVSWYEQTVLGLAVSREAQRQRAGLEAIAASADLQTLARRLGKPIRAADLYGSSAGAVGRTQMLPGYFAPGALCGDLLNKDVWNNRPAIAECTTRYLTVSGCWGAWWSNGDVWSALCSYNPGAWDSPTDAWYWAVLKDRLTRLAAASSNLRINSNLSINGSLSESALGQDTHVSTPILGLLTTEALLQNGQSAYRLPEPLAEWTRQMAPGLSTYRAQVRVLYRLFRAWAMIYYSPEDLLAVGIQL